MTHTATARASSNIAFVKYWGNRDDELRLPVNGSLSMNLAELYTETTVQWDDALTQDVLNLNGEMATGQTLSRVSEHLDRLRQRLNIQQKASVTSQNNFPMGTGIASSASAFAALTMAGVAASGQTLPEAELSILARTGSGSASRSIPTGFVEWYIGDSHETSYAESFAAPDHWDIVDVIAIVSESHKTTGSTAGHPTAKTSDLQEARIAGVADRIRICKQAILDRDFATFAEVVEYDSNLMHAVMMTSRPALFYWQPTTLTIMQAIRDWRADGLSVCYTLDAGPNVHCICIRADADAVRDGLSKISGVLDVRVGHAGAGASVIANGG